MRDDQDPLNVPKIEFTDLLRRAEPAEPANVAAPRTTVSRSQLKPIRPVITRPGALDYRDIPSRAGEERMPYTGPTSTRSRADGNA